MANQSIQGALGGIEEKIGHLQGQVAAFDTQVKGVGEDVDNTELRLGNKITEVKTDLEGDIQNIKTDLKGDIQTVKTDLKGDIQTVKTDLLGRQSLFLTFISIIVVLGGIIANFLAPLVGKLFTMPKP